MRRTGSEVATQGFVAALREAGHDVTLLAYRRVGTDPPMGAGDVAVADRHIETSTAGARPLLWMLRAVLTRRPYSVAKYVTRRYAMAARRAVRQVQPELVVLDHAQMAWLLSGPVGSCPLVYLAHNVEHALHAEMAVQPGLRALAHRREARRIAVVETRVLGRADHVWTLTPGDAETLEALAPGLSTRVFDIAPVTVPDGPGEPSRDVVMLGGWHWKPNAAGLRWFVEEVAPLLVGEGIDVVVGGAEGEGLVGDSRGLTAVGPVPDAMEFLQSAKAVVVPAVAGSGVQVKALDAIASGRRVVATSVAMRGISDPPPTVHTADGPEEFAAEVVRAVHAGSGRDLADQARKWSAERSARFSAAVADAVTRAS